MTARCGVHRHSRRCLAAPTLPGLPGRRTPTFSLIAPVVRIEIRAAAGTRSATCERWVTAGAHHCSERRNRELVIEDAG